MPLLEEHQPTWATTFAGLRDVLARQLGPRALAIHHIGSTSIPGMLAKPILDISIEMASEARLEDLSAQLAELGYRFEGDKGILDRYAYDHQSDEAPFTSPRRRWMNHHLYVCPNGSAELARSLHFRDSLVAAEELREEYRALKQRCADAANGDRKTYQARKDEWGDEFFKRVLAMVPLRERANRAVWLEDKWDAALESGAIDEAAWYREVAAVITPAYMAGDNPRNQSGYGGDDARWKQARGLIADAINRDGTFLDVGCASGYLMETIQLWARAKGFNIEPYGLDIAPELANLARGRLLHWADRIHVGNAMTWQTNRRFDFVRTGLEYVPRSRQRDFVQRLLSDVVAPGGRLILGTHNEPAASLTTPLTQDLLHSMGFKIAGSTERRHPDCRLRYRVCWIDP